MRAWLQLARVALAPTILWDAAAGALIAGVAWGADLLWPVAVLLLLYHGGMILNDWADRGVDARSGRRRPIPEGRLRPSAALAAGLGALAAALALAQWRLSSDAALWSAVLAAIVLLYDLGGATVRRTVGPVLLATARACSVMLVPVHARGSDALATVVPVEPPLVYALYFLFLARMAQHEEEGIVGMRALPYVIMAAASPCVLAFAAEPPWWFYPAWAAFAAWVAAPAWAVRHEDWTPERVQAMVRHGLASGPLVLSVCVLGYPDRVSPAWALVGLGVAWGVGRLARRFAPE